jgi:hypothetical protein
VKGSCPANGKTGGKPAVTYGLSTRTYGPRLAWSKPIKPRKSPAESPKAPANVGMD